MKVNNTFSEDHYYIKFVNQGLRKSEQNYYIEKLFHVSPFLPREGYYKIRFDNQKYFIRFDIDYFDNNEKNILVTSINGEKLKIKNNKRRLSFKEARELKELDLQLPLLEEKKIYLEKKITESGIDICETSRQLAELIASIKEYEDRWIELSDLS